MSGHIKQVKKGVWRIVVESGRDPATGRRKRIVRQIRGRKSDAEEVLAQFVTELKQGTYFEPSRIAVSEWLDTWLHEYKKADLRPRTWESYEAIIKNHLVPAIGALPLRDLRTEHLQKLYNDKNKEGLSPQTIRHIHKVIYGALKQAVKNGLLIRNPGEATTLPRNKQRKIRVFTPEEQAKFLQLFTSNKGFTKPHIQVISNSVEVLGFIKYFLLVW